MTVVEITERVRSFRVNRFTINVDVSQCQVQVVSWDWKELNGNHNWFHHGSRSFWEFLTELTDRGYLFGKLFDTRLLEQVDNERTNKAIFESIEEELSAGHISVERATELREEVERCGEAEDYFHLSDIPDIQYLMEYKDTHASDELWASWLEFRDFIRFNILNKETK